MKHLLAGLLAAVAFTTFGAVARADDTYPESHIQTINDTAKWTWITAYDGGKIKGAWCVAPHATDKHGLRAAIGSVRAEVTERNCAHPVHLDRTQNFSQGFPGVRFATYAVTQHETTQGHPPKPTTVYNFELRNGNPW